MEEGSPGRGRVRRLKACPEQIPRSAAKTVRIVACPSLLPTLKRLADVYWGLSSKWTENRVKPERGGSSARARGRKGDAPFKMTAAKVRLAMAAMRQKETKVTDLCSELAITRQTLYRHVAPDGTLRKDGGRR
jgi:hypothetical protein